MTSSNHYSITFKNQSNIIDDDKVFLVVKGQNPSCNSGNGTAPDGNTYDFSMIESYLQISGGVGTWVRVDKTGDPSEHFAVSLAELPAAAAGGRTLQVPPGVGARIYLSFDHKMHFTTKVGYKPGKVPDTLSIGEPDPCDPGDLNYYAIYDKIEYTYNDFADPKSPGVWIDTTAVDFFCMPLSLSAMALVGKSDGPDVEQQETVGLQQTRAAVISRCGQYFVAADTAPAQNWQNLALSFKGITLRIAAPNKAEHAANPFPTGYLDPYIKAVWDFYRDNDLIVDCTGLDPQPDPVLWKGRVAGTPADPVWAFSNGTDSVKLEGLPTSNQVLGCGQGIMEAKNNTPQSVVVRTIGAGLNVGVLPTADPTQVVDLAFFLAHAGQFYDPAAAHGAGYTAPVGGPSYNVYTAALHSFGDKVYAFAFDDAVGQDSTLHIDKQANGTTCVVGDMTGTKIPPTGDDRTYTCHFSVGSGSTLTYDGKAYPSGPMTLEGLPSSFPISYEVGSAGAEDGLINCYLRQSSLAGVTIALHEKTTDGTNLDIGLPGAPSDTRIQHQTAHHVYTVTVAGGNNCSGTFDGKSLAGADGPAAVKLTGSGPTITFTYQAPSDTAPVPYTLDFEDGSWSPGFPKGALPSVQQNHPEDWSQVYVALPGYAG